MFNTGEMQTQINQSIESPLYFHDIQMSTQNQRNESQFKELSFSELESNHGMAQAATQYP